MSEPSVSDMMGYRVETRLSFGPSAGVVVDVEGDLATVWTLGRAVNDAGEIDVIFDRHKGTPSGVSAESVEYHKSGLVDWCVSKVRIPAGSNAVAVRGIKPYDVNERYFAAVDDGVRVVSFEVIDVDKVSTFADGGIVSSVNLGSGEPVFSEAGYLLGLMAFRLDGDAFPDQYEYQSGDIEAFSFVPLSQFVERPESGVPFPDGVSEN